MSQSRSKAELILLKLKLASPLAFSTLRHTRYSPSAIDHTILTFCGRKFSRQAYSALSKVARRMEPAGELHEHNRLIDECGYDKVAAQLEALIEEPK